MRWPTSGSGSPCFTTALRNARSSRLRVGPMPAPTSPARTAAPGPSWVSSWCFVTSFRTSASLAARSTSSRGRVAARSRRVRIGLVTGRSWRRAGCRLVAWWKIRPGRFRGALLRGRDLDERRHRREEGQDVGGGPVAQGGAVAGDEERRDEAAAHRDRVVPDGVDPAVDDAEPPALDAAVDRPGRRPRASGAAHDRQPRPDGSRLDAITSSARVICTLTTYMGVNVQIAPGHGPILTPGPPGPANVTHPAHFRGMTGAIEPTPSLPAVLKPMLLHGVGITVTGRAAPEIAQRLQELGAHQRHRRSRPRRRAAHQRRRRPRRAGRSMGRDPGDQAATEPRPHRPPLPAARRTRTTPPRGPASRTSRAP